MWQKRDPILVTEQALTKKGLLDTAKIAEMKAKAVATVDAAIVQAKSDPEPTTKDMFSHIFTPQKVG
jgi:TPP-dependent pyruvate/acetoin dehydrogenase alpha subunit